MFLLVFWQLNLFFLDFILFYVYECISTVICCCLVARFLKKFLSFLGSDKMQNLRNTVLSYVRIGIPMKGHFVPQGLNGANGHLQLLRACSTAAGVNQDQVMDRVIRLVKKFGNIDSDKVITLYWCDDMPCSNKHKFKSCYKSHTLILVFILLW